MTDGGNKLLPGRFPPHILREYSLLADGHRGALCGPAGAVVWMCAPRWHDDAVFSALMGGPGGYAITPVERYVWGGHYEARSLIWRNRWITNSTTLECRDALAYPGEPDRVIVLRRIEAVEHEAQVRVWLDARAGFGSEPMGELQRDADGRWRARTGRLRMRWSGAAEAEPDRHGALTTEITVPAGGHHDLVLEIGTGPFPAPVDPRSAWHSTADAWNRALPRLDHVLAPRDAQHACAVLRGLTSPGGGMVAAATMCLPEHPARERNFDYRYTWIRDQCYAGIALARHGAHDMLADGAAFIADRVLDDGANLKPAYTVDGEPIPEEQVVNLPGYPGGSRVARGNRVRRQFQLDTFGELLQLMAEAARHGVLDGSGWRAVRIAVRTIEESWQRTDAGIWEVGEEWWTHSRLSCVAGLRAAATVTPDAQDGNHMLALSETILAETSRRCLHPTGYWQRSPERSGTDASLLLPAVRGALPTDDPRTRATLKAVREQLGSDGYVYRFPQAPRPLGSVEGAFLLCGFVIAQAEWQQGNKIDALRWFERNRAACGPPGLFAEEYDVEQRQLRGNLPKLSCTPCSWNAQDACPTERRRG